ncbi:MAG: GatB/YqeY domain-containing protein [Candidatus Spechtbacterales bacterium]
MGLKQQAQQDMIIATKGGQKATVSTLRLLLAELGKKEIELGKKEEGLTPTEEAAVVLKEIRKREEAIIQYRVAGRTESVQAEEAEVVVLKQYAPVMASNEEIEAAVEGAIKKIGASSMADMGVVMRMAMATLGVRASGDAVSALVRSKLS